MTAVVLQVEVPTDLAAATAPLVQRVAPRATAAAATAPQVQRVAPRATAAALMEAVAAVAAMEEAAVVRSTEAVVKDALTLTHGGPTKRARKSHAH